MAKSGSLPVWVNEVSLEHSQAHLFIFVSSSRVL